MGHVCSSLGQGILCNASGLSLRCWARKMDGLAHPSCIAPSCASSEWSRLHTIQVPSRMLRALTVPLAVRFQSFRRLTRPARQHACTVVQSMHRRHFAIVHLDAPRLRSPAFLATSHSDVWTTSSPPIDVRSSFLPPMGVYSHTCRMGRTSLLRRSTDTVPLTRILNPMDPHF